MYGLVCSSLYSFMSHSSYILSFIHQSSFPKTLRYVLSSSGVEVTHIIVVLAVIITLVVGGIVISLYIRYRL